MTTFRLISLNIHGAIELLLGLTLILVPFAGGFGLAGSVTSVSVGALIVGLALSAAASDTVALDISAHYAYDVGLIVGLIGAAVVLSFSGDLTAGLAMLAGAAVALALNLTTRYSLRH